jgi:hypothetical protein
MLQDSQISVKSFHNKLSTQLWTTEQMADQIYCRALRQELREHRVLQEAVQELLGLPALPVMFPVRPLVVVVLQALR